MRLRWFGPNVGYDPIFDPQEIAAAGFNSLAIVVTRDIDLSGYLVQCAQAGITVCGIIAGGSIPTVGDGPRRLTGRSLLGFPHADEAAAYYAATYPGIGVWTVLNEADGVRNVHDDGSWILDDDDASEIVQSFVRAFPPATPLYAVGTVTGNPAYFDDPDGAGVLNLQGCAGIDNHAYTHWPETVWAALRQYDFIDARYEMSSRVIREFGWPHPDPGARGKYISNMVKAIEAGNVQRTEEGLAPVDGMWVYCWDQVQHWQPFFVNHPATLEHIRPLGYGANAPLPEPVPPPPPPPVPSGWRSWAEHDFPGFSLGPGMHEALVKRGYRPLESEEYFSPAKSTVLAEKAGEGRRWLLYSKATGDVTVFEGVKAL